MLSESGLCKAGNLTLCKCWYSKNVGFHTGSLTDISHLIKAGKCYKWHKEKIRKTSPGPTGNLDKFQPGMARSVSA